MLKSAVLEAAVLLDPFGRRREIDAAFSVSLVTRESAVFDSVLFAQFF